MSEYLNRHFAKENIQMSQEVHTNLLNITDNQKNANVHY